MKNLPTLALENKIAEKYFEAIWDKLTHEQRMAVLQGIEKETGVNLDKSAIAAMSGAAVIVTLTAVISTSVMVSGVAVPTFLLIMVFVQPVVTWAAATFLGITMTTGKVGIGVLALSGPIGWAIAAGLAGAGAFFMGSAEKETVSAFILTASMIKAKKYLR